MAKGVFVHRADSIYDDLPEERYQFPRRYLRRVQASAGDWIVYYEPRGGGGRMGYNAIARIREVVPDETKPDMYLAIVEPRSYLPFERFVPYHGDSGFMESALQKPDGTLNKGRVQWAVRPISDEDFARVLALGFPTGDLLPRADAAPDASADRGFFEKPLRFIGEDPRERVEMTISSIPRDRVFRRIVLQAYDNRCAVTGLKLINGAGRAEVEAAHIKPVSANGPDIIHNGIALSGTVHWMFDRGLIGLTDEMDILISRQINDQDRVRGLINASGKAHTPEVAAQRPHPRYLAWHREHCFKQ